MKPYISKRETMNQNSKNLLDFSVVKIRDVYLELFYLSNIDTKVYI